MLTMLPLDTVRATVDDLISQLKEKPLKKDQLLMRQTGQITEKCTLTPTECSNDSIDYKLIKIGL